MRLLKKIVNVAKKLLGCIGPEVVSSEFARAFEAAERATCDPSKLPPEALTLLPLLLSHVDRTLPIVLFTSSHQRVVSEMLQHCPNVITSFAKPLVSGYGEAISPADSVRDLEDAIKKAIELHEVRIAWKRVCELVPKNAVFQLAPTSVNVNVNYHGRSAELRLLLAELFETCVFGNVYESIKPTLGVPRVRGRTVVRRVLTIES